MTFFSHFTWKGSIRQSGWNSQTTSCSCQLARPYNNQLMTPCQLFDWVCSNIPVAYFEYFSNINYAREQSSMECCFQLLYTIFDARKLLFCANLRWHSGINYKFYSSSDVFRKEKVALARMIFYGNRLLGLSFVYMKGIGGQFVCLKFPVTLRK